MFNEATFLELFFPSSDNGRSIYWNVVSLKILTHDVITYYINITDYLDR